MSMRKFLLAFSLLLVPSLSFAQGMGGLLVTDVNGLNDVPACLTDWIPTQQANYLECTDPATINVGTATELAANPANCSAGNYPLGIDETGAVESCTADDDTPDSDAEVPDDITIASSNNIATAGRLQLGHLTAGSASCIAVDTDRTFGDLDCDGTKDGGEEYLDETGGGASHDVLSATHSDTDPAAVSRGSIIVGDATPEWSELTIGAASSVLQSDGTDLAYVSTLDMGTNTIKTGANDTIIVDLATCPRSGYIFTDPVSGSGHVSITLPNAISAGAYLYCQVPVPAIRMGGTVRVVAARLNYSGMDATTYITQTTLYVNDAGGTKTDICHRTDNITSGSQFDFATSCASGSGFPYSMAADETVVVTVVSDNGNGAPGSLYTVEVDFDTD